MKEEAEIYSNQIEKDNEMLPSSVSFPTLQLDEQVPKIFRGPLYSSQESPKQSSML